MDRSSETEFCTALAPATSGSCSQSAQYFTTRSESMSRGMGESGGSLGSIEEQIERSKSHWSNLTDSDSTLTDDEVAADNLAVYEELQGHPSWGKFFRTFGYDTQVWKSTGMMEVGEKFAEGGQAELFHAKITWRHVEYDEYVARERRQWAVKVFKKGTLLRDLREQWPQGYLHWWAESLKDAESGIPPRPRFYCDVKYGALLRDGRFAFVMEMEHKDLRGLIDIRMSRCGYDHGPFQEEYAEWYMYCIASGTDWLHKKKVVHRDLKASNVLVYEYEAEKYSCYVADFECSVGVVGTGFWRAPEILQALKEKNISQKPELFSEKADAYSYAMTCYEVLTGKIPFEDHPLKEHRAMLTDLVIMKGARPEVPDYVNVWTRDLLRKCWQSNPSTRPSFEEIVKIFEAKSKSKSIEKWALKRKEGFI